jgi:hypothetical protein
LEVYAADGADAALATVPAGKPLFRIAAGRDAPYKDAKGNTWDADATYANGGSTIERPDLNVTGTDEPGLYRAERYSMDGYTFKVPNGNYMVKLHFAETYEGISSPADRVFTFAVQGKQFKDFSPWKAAGAQFKAYVETVKDVKVADGTLKITFTPQVENPQICGLEIFAGDALDAPATAPASQNADAGVTKGMKYPDLVKLLGQPDRDEGSGIHIYVYKRPNNKELWVGLNGTTPDAEVVYVWVMEAAGR